MGDDADGAELRHGERGFLKSDLRDSCQILKIHGHLKQGIQEVFFLHSSVSPSCCIIELFSFWNLIYHCLYFFQVAAIKILKK